MLQQQHEGQCQGLRLQVVLSECWLAERLLESSCPSFSCGRTTPAYNRFRITVCMHCEDCVSSLLAIVVALPNLDLIFCELNAVSKGPSDLLSRKLIDCMTVIRCQ